MADVEPTAEPAERADATDRIRAILNTLVHERQGLRHAGNDQAALEANRLAIVYWQQELSSRLIEVGAR